MSFAPSPFAWSGFFAGVVMLLAFLIVLVVSVAFIVLVVRFLLVATRAAHRYLELHPSGSNGAPPQPVVGAVPPPAEPPAAPEP